MKRKAFTLIELLTVMAITAVMLTLIVLPIFQSFQVLRTGQAFADAQDKGRLLVDRISREVGNAVSVRNAASTVAVIPGIGEVELPYTKLDLIPPAQGTPDGTLGPGVYRDPLTGKIDPTLTRPKGDVNINGVPGPTIVRWWIGLNRPADASGNPVAYNEPYTGILMARNGSRDNLYVLRRAEVQPFVYRARKDGQANSSAWRPNLAYFRSDDDRGDGGEFDTRIIDLDDKKFFVLDGQYLPEGNLEPNRVADPQKNARVLNWAKASVIQTEISRYDMVRPVVQGSPPQVVRDSSGKATVVPLVQFRPTRVGSAPAAGSAAARTGESVEGIDRIGPDTYRTERGLWTDAIVRFYPGGYAPSTTTGILELATINSYGAVQISNGEPAPGGQDGIAAYPQNWVLFDAQTYERYLARGQAYPFTAACASASGTDVQSGYPGTPWQQVDAMRELFTPFRALTGPGKIVTSFPIDEVGKGAVPSGGPNLPYIDVKSADSPTKSPGNGILTPVVGSRTENGRNPGYDPNQAFNSAWNTYPELQGVLQRFIDLRFVPNEDSTFSPLCPIVPTSTGDYTGFIVRGGTENRVRITPGSDEVVAPSQLEPNYGERVRYTRVTGNPGPNQYRLVYADLPEPKDAAGNIDYSILGFSNAVMNSGGGPFAPTNYSENNVVSTMIQPRFKAGYLQFCSDPNVPMPVGRISVKYRFQFTGPSDTFAVDLDTREVMQILLTIKNYPQSSAPNAQSVTLKATATLRNALR